MRNRSILSIGAAALVLCLAAAQSFGAYDPNLANKLTTSKHNMNRYTGAVITGNQVCLPCHTPHNANTSLDNGEFLWNHTVNFAQSYQLYTGSTGHVTSYTSSSSGNPVLDTDSKLCLSCHDGLIAVDNYGGAYAKQGTAVITGSKNLGTDLRNDHPIGIGYPGLSNDGLTFTGTRYFSPLETGFTTSTPPAVGGGAISIITLPDGRKGIGCTTCHTPHTPTYGFLRMSNDGSAMCFKCHNK